MTDDSQTDAETADGAVADEESTDDSRIDEFLERIEDDQQPESISPESSGGISAPSDSTPSEPSDSAPSEPSNVSPSQTDTDGSQKRGRLWDSFSADRAADAEPTPSDPATESPQDPAVDVDEWTARDETHESTPPDSTAAASASPPPTAEPAADPDAKPAAEPDEKSATTDADESNGRSSFRTILERISHRIGSVGSSSAAEDAEAAEAASTAGSTEASTSDAGAATRTTPNAESATRGANGGRSTGSTRSDTIDEILNNIDLFGRATSSSQVLLLSPTAHSITNDIYSRFLLPTDGAGQNILYVSATQSATDQLAAARNIPDWREGNTAVIEVGQSTLSPGRPGTGADVTKQLDIYKQISNLKHLAKLGINISHIVSKWDNSRRPTVVGVHTLSAIQQYVGNETMFQFLFTLKGQLNSMGVMGFYHMDPAVHTENEISTIQSAFDLVIKVSSDGSVDIL